jgi:hypothetical protein
MIVATPTGGKAASELLQLDGQALANSGEDRPVTAGRGHAGGDPVEPHVARDREAAQGQAKAQARIASGAF